MKKVFIIHGFEGRPNGGWRPWLMAELEKVGVYACALAMPTPEKPILSEWIEEISRLVAACKKDEIYLVGHSLGVPTILHYLENTKAKNIKGAVLISGPIFKTTKKELIHFLDEPFQYKKIKSKVKKFSVIHGDDDKMVPFNQGEALAKELECELVTVKKGGHLNSSAGFVTLPQCITSLNKIMK